MTSGNGGNTLQATVKIGLPEALAIALHGHPRKLKDELKKIARSGSGMEHSRLAATLQLGTVIQWLQHDPEIAASNDLQPLHQLFAALHDLCAGRRPSVLFDAVRPDNVTTKPKVASAHIAQGVLVIAYRALVERARWKPARARQWLDRELRAHDMHELVCGQDIQQWHNKSMTLTGRLAPTVMEATKYYAAELSSLRDEAGALAFARKYLDIVRDLRPERLRLRQD